MKRAGSPVTKGMTKKASKLSYSMPFIASIRWDCWDKEPDKMRGQFTGL
jgi:hypothetical protein